MTYTEDDYRDALARGLITNGHHTAVHAYYGSEAHRALAMGTQAYRDQMRGQAQQGHSSLAALQERIGPLHVVNGHMPLAAGEVAELRPKLTLRYVLGVLVDLGATLGFIAFVAFLLSRAGS